MTKFFYRVQKEDSVSSLAERFNLPQIKIISLNGLKKEIREGDILYIEREKATTYKVGLFDTTDSVAKKFNMDKDEFLALNGVEYIFYGLTVLVQN